ncbi:MAG: DUF5634 family protein [Desulfuromonadaceae bacterium]|nr:DUF5634 family protein [Desulfuromonadaceae bacterium]
MPQLYRDKKYMTFLRHNHQIKISLHLSNDTDVDVDAVIVGIDGTVLHLKTFGNCDKELSEVPVGTSVVILSSDTWAFCRFYGTLGQAFGSNISVQLHGQPDIKQRRDYFRLDIQMPVICKSPHDQQLSSLEGTWKACRLMHKHSGQPCIKPFNDSFKVLNWGDGIVVEPCMVNLSGGGLKMIMAETFKHGHLLELTIFLPAPSIRAIFAVASVIRSTEVSFGIDNLKAYSVAMKFVFITEMDRERIISHIFNEQPE